jgi:outer membrane protein OmpA-like peptidoglycan-associated protein
LTTGSITKLCVAGVLWSALVMSSQAAEPDGGSVDRPVPTATKAQIEALENYSVVSLKRVHFSTGDSTPSSSAAATLDQITNTLSERSASIIELRGYADGSASPAANIALSLERANVIARILMKRGVARERILILGLGEVDPTGPRGRAEHQRVDLRVFAPPTAETSVRRESVVGWLIQDTWGGKIEP